MRVHWLQNIGLNDWLAQQRSLLQADDVILLTDQALTQLPAQAPCSNNLYTLAAEQQAGDVLPDYLEALSDQQWVTMVLGASQQMTW